MCAITTLSISIKAEHYSECVNARILQLDDLFQAKLGWLVGQKYSRVGTPDWDESELNKFVSDAIENTAIWVPDEKMKRVDKEIEKRRVENPEVEISLQEVKNIVDAIKSKKDEAIETIVGLIEQEGCFNEEKLLDKAKIIKKFRNDPVFSRFFK